MTLCKTEKCTGCMACVNVCPVSAISVQTNDEGFEYPIIDQSKCLRCKKCEKVCPHFNEIIPSDYEKKVYAVWSNDDKTRKNSTSGGAFAVISKKILENGGYVVGCALDDSNVVRHIIVDNIENLYKLQGSKYVQSSISDVYKRIKDLLSNDKMVLFSGTPCQVAGLKNYIGSYKKGKLFTIDVVCHGVPSPMIFSDYMNYLESKYHSKVKTISFRSKRESWFSYGMEITFVNRKKYFKSTYKDPFIRGFLRQYFLRPSCHSCKYTNTRRVSDLTLADFWGYKSIDKNDRDDDKGISMVMINSSDGEDLFCSLSGISMYERTVDEAVKGNRCLREPFPPSNQRENFWKDYKTMSFKKIVSKYLYSEKTPYFAVKRYVDINYRNLNAFSKKILAKIIFKLGIKY